MISRQLWKSLRKPLPLHQNPLRANLTSRISFNFASTGSKYNQEKNEDYENNENRESYSYYKGSSIPFVTILPMLAIMTHKITKASCLFSSSKFEKNKITGRVELVQYPANSPIQDRWEVAQLETIPGYVAIVLDGHGGWQMAEYAKKHLVPELEKALKANKGKFSSQEEYIKASLKEAFDKVENGFLNIARNTYNMGFPAIGSVGASALVALVHGNKVYTANAGDSKGVICSNEKGKITLKKVNHRQRAGSKKEQEKLKQQSTEHDIYVCDPFDPKSCSIKNKIRTTKSLGDFDMKYPEFNDPKNLGIDFGHRMKIENFKGPYITHEPEIQVHNIEKNDKYLVLSTNGVWEQLSKNEVTQIVEKNLNDKQKLSGELVNSSVQKAAQKNNRTETEVRGVKIGPRRKIHDDMTVIVVDLENQGQ